MSEAVPKVPLLEMGDALDVAKDAGVIHGVAAAVYLCAMQATFATSEAAAKVVHALNTVEGLHPDDKAKLDQLQAYATRRGEELVQYLKTSAEHVERAYTHPRIAPNIPFQAVGHLVSVSMALLENIMGAEEAEPFVDMLHVLMTKLAEHTATPDRDQPFVVGRMAL